MQPTEISKWPESQFRVTDEQPRMWKTCRKSSKVDTSLVDSTNGPWLLSIPRAFLLRLRDLITFGRSQSEIRNDKLGNPNCLPLWVALCMSCCVSGIRLSLRRLVNEMSINYGSAARWQMDPGTKRIRRGLSFTVLALACCALQQAWVVTVAQTERPRVAIGNAGTMETTKSGTAGGVRSPALTGERRPLYRVTTSDVLDLSFTFSPEYNQTITVQPDGFVVLKDLGTMYAEGTTLPQLQEAIRTAYSQLLNNPQVTIVLKDFDKPYFIAAGEVTRPGKYDLRGDTTVTEAVAMAGGFNSQARHSQVVLFRRMSDEMVETRLIDVKRMMSARNLNEDLHLKPGDLLFVPQNTISKLRKFLPGSNFSMYVNPTQF